MKAQEIEDFATEVVQTEGLGKVSFRTIADAVGVKSSSVHYHFRTKLDLVEKLILSYTRKFEAALGDLEEQHPRPKERVLAFAEIFAEVLSNEKLCLCGVMAVSVNELNDASKEALQRFFKVATEWLETTFAQSETELAISLEPKQLAQVLLSGLEGAILVDRASQSRQNLDSQMAFIEGLFSKHS